MDIRIRNYCRVTSGTVWLNGEAYLEPDCRPFDAQRFLSDIYKRSGIDYRKFFKMDTLSKLGFLCAELVLSPFDKEQPKEETGIILFNRSSSLEADEAYQQTIREKDNYFPSPSVFVYTLPNIVTGEIAIRNRIHGETAFYVFPRFQSRQVEEIIRGALHASGLRYLLAGWTEVYQGQTEALMMLCERGGTADDSLPLHPERLEELWNMSNLNYYKYE